MTAHPRDLTMLWLCLRFPNLPFSAAFAAHDEGAHDAPRALHDSARRTLVACADAQAQRAGVHPGQTVSAALGQCSRLVLRPRDPAAERQLLELLAAWAYSYSSEVSLGGEDALLLEVGASLNLFGGWPALLRRLRADLAEFGQVHRLALAPVAAAARVLVRCADGLALPHRAPLLAALGRVPLALSGLDAAAIATLHNAGLRRLREVFALPRPELRRRIGSANLLWLDRLRGDAPEVLDLYRPPDRYARRIELDQAVESWLPLQFPLRRLTRELAVFLAARDGGVQRFELVLEHERRAATRVAVNLLSPQRDAAALYEFSRGRLERAELGAEVIALALVASDLPAFRPRHRDLFESEREQALDWPDLAERLRARLGDAALRALAVGNDHRPERAHRSSAPTRHDPGPGGPRPLWLLPRPLPLRPPPQRILAGPERIESGWWDSEDIRRDYYIVRTRSGQRAWAFLPAGAREGWMLHGWFA